MTTIILCNHNNQHAHISLALEKKFRILKAIMVIYMATTIVGSQKALLYKNIHLHDM